MKPSMSSSKLCIVPAQDALGLGAGNRMNTPGKEGGNWQWRMPPSLFDGKYFEPVKKLTVAHGREADAEFVL